MAGLLRRLITHPLAAGADIDSPAAAARRARIVRSKPFLRALYEEWYGALRAGLPAVEGALVELGAAGGFLDAVLPGVIRTDAVAAAGLDAVLDARALPFADRTLRALLMTNVFHHVPDADRFLRESARCLVPGGRVLMWEPWVTPWSRVVYRYLHHEPFEPEARSWAFPSDGPLSGANEALPWIVFARDRARFERRHGALRLVGVRPAMPVCYLLSGGVRFRSPFPAWCYPLVRQLEQGLSRWRERLAMFALIVLERRA